MDRNQEANKLQTVDRFYRGRVVFELPQQPACKPLQQASDEIPMCYHNGWGFSDQSASDAPVCYGRQPPGMHEGIRSDSPICINRVST